MNDLYVSAYDRLLCYSNLCKRGIDIVDLGIFGRDYCGL